MYLRSLFKTRHRHICLSLVSSQKVQDNLTSYLTAVCANYWPVL